MTIERPATRIEVIEPHRRESCYFIGLSVHDPLPEHDPVLMIQRGQQVHRATVGCAGAAGGLAVHRDRRPAARRSDPGSEPARNGAVQQVRIDRLQHPADRGLTRRDTFDPQALAHSPGQVLGPLGDRGA